MREVRLLEVAALPPVRERALGVAIGEAARDLVGEDEAEPDGQLKSEIPPSTRQITPPHCGYGRHRGCILTRPFGQGKPLLRGSAHVMGDGEVRCLLVDVLEESANLRL